MRNPITSPSHLPGRTPRKFLLLAALAMLATPAVAQSPAAPLPALRPLQQHGGAAVPLSAGGSRLSPASIPLKIKLPFPAGKSYPIIQGNHGTFTHTGLNTYAWDFAMPEGSEISAAAAGRVVRVKQDGKLGGPDKAYFHEGNMILIDHGDGYFSHYLHLAHNGVLVKEGDLVRGGQVIASSGNTGFSTTPHLHFHVQNATGQSLPVRFQDLPDNAHDLSEPLIATSQNDGTGLSQYYGESHLPPDAFLSNNVGLITQNLPGHLFRLEKEYEIRGRVNDAQSRQVAIYIMGTRGGKALHTIYASADRDGFFKATLKPNDIKTSHPDWSQALDQSNLFNLAIAPVKTDGSFWSEISVPICIR